MTTAMDTSVPPHGAPVFLAGATGVIGRRLIPLLVAAGHPVTAMTRRADRAEPLRALGAEPVVVDVFDRGALHAAMAAARPAVVIHQLTDLAAYDLDANARMRAEGTRNLVDAARAAGARRIVAQSVAWCYAPGDGPADEATPLDVDADGPRRATVRGVAALEQAVQALPEWVVLRYGMFIGPGTWFVPDGARAADARAGRLTATGDVTSFVHVDDAAAATVQALGWPGGAVNVCDDDPVAGHVWVPAFCAAVGAPPPPVEDDRAPWARGADNGRARALGWAPRHTWREALR
ncbi:MAG: NAD-dependent epimerase/dehydratase family protein [Thermoleophilia bacterium]